MSVITYNGVTLPFAYHTDFREEALYDPVGDTDWYCTKFDISVEAMLHADYLVLLFPTLAGKTLNAAIIKKAIRPLLMQPRKALSITFNEVNLLPQATANPLLQHPVDAMNGPKPQYCNITQLHNTCFLLSYRIIAHYWENNAVDPNAVEQENIVSNRTGNNVLYNRWTETVEYDNLNYAKRTRDGKFGIRSDNTDGRIADEVRSQMAVVSVPAGFLRESSRYTVTPDGLAIAYTIVDKEVFKKPPAPAFEAEGHYTETATRQGAIRMGECRVRLKADKTTDQIRLVNEALTICNAKLAIRGHQLVQGEFARRTFTILEHASIRMNLYENEVECVIRCIMQADNQRKNGIAAFQDMDNLTPQSDRNYTPFYKDRGTSAFLIQAAAYYDPSLRQTVIGAGTNFSATNPLSRTAANQVQLSTGTQVGKAGRDGE